jgi:DHA1 family inner membrane transport protein
MITQINATASRRTAIATPMSDTKDKKGIPPALWALTISGFAIGTTEFVIVGLLPTIANDLHISVSAAGLLVSIYALGVAIGAPVLTALTSKIARKPLMMLLMGLFIAGHIAAAIAPTFFLLLIARFVTGFAHGVFFGVGTTIAASLVAPDKRAGAIAIMFAGLTVAIVTGVPLGTLTGQIWGWQATFIGVAVLGAIGLLSIALLLPSRLQKGHTASLKDQLKLLRNLPLLLVLFMTILGYGGTFVTFTYLSPLLQQVTGVSENMVSVLLLIYGIAIALGNLIGGKIANKRPVNALFWMFALQGIVLLAFSFTVYYTIPAIITLFIMGGLSFATVPALQLYVVQIAERSSTGTADVAAALNIAAFNIGIAIGAWIGGKVVISALGLRATPWIGALFLAVAIVVTIFSSRLNKASH